MNMVKAVGSVIGEFAVKLKSARIDKPITARAPSVPKNPLSSNPSKPFNVYFLASIT